MGSVSNYDWSGHTFAKIAGNRDEILFNARIHPEQYSNTLNDKQIDQLHKSLHYVCSTAVSVLADSDKFPEDWLMKHRWGKGKKEQNKLPNGQKITFLTVGGRTSAIVPSLQKKTGPVAGDADVDRQSASDSMSNADEPTEEGKKSRKKGPAKKATPAEHGATDGVDGDAVKPSKSGRWKKETTEEGTENGVNGEQAVNGADASTEKGRRGRGGKGKDKAAMKAAVDDGPKAEQLEEEGGRTKKSSANNAKGTKRKRDSTPTRRKRRVSEEGAGDAPKKRRSARLSQGN